MGRPYILAETNWAAVQKTQFELAVLPWGATEAHNYHLPYATDNYQAEYVCAQSAEIAWNDGAKVIVLPCIPFGVNTGQMDIDLCMNLNPSTQQSILDDICEVLANCGIEKLAIINGHGGNHFKQMIRELSVGYPELFVCSANWWQAAGNENEVFEEPGDHAGELESSCMYHIAPELCLPIDQAGSGAAKQFSITGFKEGWVSAQREWSQVTEDTGVGNPAKATAEKGDQFLSACAKKIGQLFIELCETDLGNLYE